MYISEYNFRLKSLQQLHTMAVNGPRRRYYTPQEVALHNSAEDCWVSIFHNVYDLSTFLKVNRGKLAQPIIEMAGGDISHWFDPITRDVKTRLDPKSNLEQPYMPRGAFLHVAPPTPDGDWATNFGTPWWRNEDFLIGKLSKKTRQVRIVNVLSRQEKLLTVCSEESILEIRERYLEFNAHAASYTWKHLVDDEFVPLDMERTLAENGCEDESAEFEELGIDQDFYIPVIHLYFDDDLTVL